MAGSRFSKLFKQDNVPDKTVEEVQIEISSNKDLRNADKEKFLSDMAEIESSSGKNLAHKMLESGMHAGQKAVGQYGFMPKTIKDMTKRMGDEAPGALKALVQVPDEQEMATLVMQDPELEQAVADKMYSVVEDTQEGNPEKMNLAWEIGQNAKISPARLESHPRTERFRNLRKKIVLK